MRKKPVVPRAQAHADIDAALTYYALQAGAETAYGFIAAIEDALRSIGDHPAIGSLSYARTVKVAGLRSRRVRAYPYLIFYVEIEDRIEIWRVLHAQRDIAPLLQSASAEVDAESDRPLPD